MGKKTPKKSVAPGESEVNTTTPMAKGELPGTPKSVKKLKTPKKDIDTAPTEPTPKSVKKEKGVTPKSGKKLMKEMELEDSEPVIASPMKKKRKSEVATESPKKKKKASNFEPQPPKGKKLPKKKSLPVKEDDAESDDSESEEEPLYDDVPVTDSEEEEADRLEEEDMRAERKKQKKENILKHAERTIFVGNLPKDTNTDELKKIFKKYGTIDTARLRSAPVADTRVPKKVSVITKQFHEDRSNINAYVVYKSEDSVEKALAANGILVQNHHIRVDRCVKKKVTHDQKKAIFMGNLPFGIEEEKLWNIFGTCGEIENVRIIRDSMTGIGKGFGYINFKNSDAVELALMKNGMKIEKREVRVTRCDPNSKSKQKNKITNKNEKIARRNKDRSFKKQKREKNGAGPGNKKPGKETSSFQGQTVLTGKVVKKEKKPKLSAKKKKVVETLTNTMQKSNKKIKFE